MPAKRSKNAASLAAKRGWETRRAKKQAKSNAAKKGWETRRFREEARQYSQQQPKVEKKKPVSNSRKLSGLEKELERVKKQLEEFKRKEHRERRDMRAAGKQLSIHLVAQEVYRLHAFSTKAASLSRASRMTQRQLNEFLENPSKRNFLRMARDKSNIGPDGTNPFWYHQTSSEFNS